MFGLFDAYKVKNNNTVATRLSVLENCLRYHNTVPLVLKKVPLPWGLGLKIYSRHIGITIQ